MQDFRSDGDQYAFDLNRRMEEFSKRLAQAIEIEQVGILRDRGEDRLAVRGHALMDAMHFGRAVDAGVHRYRYQYVKRVNAVRIGGWDRVVRTRGRARARPFPSAETLLARRSR